MAGGSGAPDKGFKVDTDKLSAVADKIQALVDDISGNSGFVRGSFPEFQKAGDISAGLQPFWGKNEDVFAEAYGDEFKAVSETYQLIITQLTNLATAASQTASGYGTSEQNLADQLKKLQQQGGGR